MQTTVNQTSLNNEQINKWMRRAGTAGFVFFLAKGLVWIGAAVWLIS